MMGVSASTLLVLPLLLGVSPLMREQPDVRAGNERLVQGDAAGALEHYQAAEHAVGTRPEVDYDRGIALLRQGKTAEALAALRRAAERGDGPLASRALQNAGGALDAAGDRDGAIRSFADALARDPSNEDARFNLEVLLRRRDQERKSGGAKDQPEKREAKSGQREQEQAKSGGAPDERGDRKGGQEQPQSSQPKDGKRPDGAQPKPDDHGGAQGRAAADTEAQKRAADTEAQKRAADTEAQKRAADAGRAGAGEPTSRQDAERLLDAMRARERNLPPGAWQRRETRRRDVEKDW